MQQDITKLRKHLPSLMSKDRNERYFGIWSMFNYLPSPSPSQMALQGVLPPQTIKLVAGGCFQGNKLRTDQPDYSFLPEQNFD